MASIFPLIREWPNSKETAGTAFLIAEGGYFATAAHVPESTPDLTFGAALDPGNLTATCALTWIVIAPALDLAIGRLETVPADVPLVLALTLPVMDAPIRGFGFPAKVATICRDQKYLVTARPVQQQDAIFRGYTDDFNIPAATDRHGFHYAARKMRAVLSSPPFEEGYSGGPVFNADKRVIGVNSSTSHDKALWQRLNHSKPFAVNASGDALLMLVQQSAPAIFPTVLGAAER